MINHTGYNGKSLIMRDYCQIESFISLKKGASNVSLHLEWLALVALKSNDGNHEDADI